MSADRGRRGGRTAFDPCCRSCVAARLLRVPPRASLLLRKFYCGDRPVAIMASDRNSETVEFIEPKPVHRSSLSVSQNHGFANKLGLSTRIVQALVFTVGMVDGW